MRPFSLLIKPASADCNLRCEYCFYIDHLVEGMKAPRMSDEILDIMIKSYMSTNQNNIYSFGWQGGEPTIMGLNFFKRVVELQQKYGPPGAVVSNGLQTNGTLITEEMAKFFAEYKFLLGVSLDGPEYLHDYYRKTIGQKPTHHLVLRGIENLKKHNVEFNILILINNKTVKKATEIYQYLKERGFYYHQYIPCVEFDGSGQPLPYTISGEAWGNFLCELYDEWYMSGIKRVSIRLFDSILLYLMKGEYNICHMAQKCNQYFVVEYNGDVYPCDFFVEKRLLLGNVMENDWEELQSSLKYQHFGKKKSIYTICKKCEYQEFCNGDCLRCRNDNGEVIKTTSWLCFGWKMFYKHAIPGFQKMTDHIRNRNVDKQMKEDIVHQSLSKKIGRNDPCSCGSGLKYKLCCGK